MKFAKYLFLFAGISGLIMLVPQYFLEEKTGRDFPPAITHPEHFYGFIGVAIACQVMFLIISRNPVRYRAMMIPAMLEKFSFAIAVAILFLQNRVAAVMFGLGMMDLALGLLFTLAFFKTPKQELV
ncbi:MAG TPA: hypothetical protein VK892_23415 [Pyrinomonadaceae bacterium]|nr:hypothetical protein [Pyrinomonadaceae bacterium]